MGSRRFCSLSLSDDAIPATVETLNTLGCSVSQNCLETHAKDGFVYFPAFFSMSPSLYIHLRSLSLPEWYNETSDI